MCTAFNVLSFKIIVFFHTWKINSAESFAQKACLRVNETYE